MERQCALTRWALLTGEVSYSLMWGSTIFGSIIQFKGTWRVAKHTHTFKELPESAS